VVLALGAVIFRTAWAIGGEDAVSDNWVGMSVVALFTGLTGSFVALLLAAYAGMPAFWRAILECGSGTA